MILATALLVFRSTIPGPAPEGESFTYLVRVTRLEANLYQLDETCDEDGCVQVRTRYCEEYPLGKRAIFEWSPVWDVDSLTFLESGRTCDVVGE